MITTLTIKGYRTLKDVTWTPGRLNVLIGPNGSGKSNLLRALRLLRSCAEGRLQKALVEEGGIKSILWDQDSNMIEIDASWTSDCLFIDDDIQFNFRYNIAINGFSGSFHKEQLISEHNKESETILTRDYDRLCMKMQNIGMQDVKRSANSGEALISQGGPGTDWKIQSASEDLAFPIYFGIDTKENAETRRSAVVRLEMVLEEDGSNLTPVLQTLYATDRTFKRALDQAMIAAFGPDYDELVFPPAADQRIQLRIRWHSLKSEQPMANLSDGTIRFLALAAILLNPDPPPLIAIDEPETGLHPGMFPIIADMAAEAAQRTQVLLTTHSPQFLDAMGQHNPTVTVAMLEDGATTLTVLDQEDLTVWLEKYSLGQLFTSGTLEALR